MSGYEYGKGDMGGRYDRGMAQEYRGGDMGGREGMMEKIPGTEAHRAHQGRSDNMGKTASDPVYGETKPHKTDMGAKAESTWHKAKANMPGTKEHRMMKEGNEGEGRYDNVRDEADRAAMGYERRHGQETAGGDWGQERTRGTGVGGVGAAGGYDTMGDRGYEGAAGGAGGFGTSEAGYHKHGTTGASAGYGSQPTSYSTERRTHDEHEDKGIMGQMMDKVKSVLPGAKTDEEKRVQEHSGRGAEGGSMGGGF